MEKYTKVARKENTKNTEGQQPIVKPGNIYTNNTPHSWSNVVGFGDIKISTSDNKHYLRERYPNN